MYTIKYTYEDKIEEVVTDKKFYGVLQDKINAFKSEFPSTSSVFCKISWCRDSGESHDLEVKCYEILKDSGLTPKFIEGKILCKVVTCSDDYISDEITISLLKTEMCGKSLLDLYFPNEIRMKYQGPGEYIHNENTIADDIVSFFPQEFVPKNIFRKVVDILTVLCKNYRIEHNDIHPGNFLQKDKNIYIIDFEGVDLR